MTKTNDFSKGSVVGNIIKLAIPMTLAQLVNVLYNIVDRMYIGYLPKDATLSLTGMGLTLPIITIIIAFANLFGMGGAPLCSIARGRGDHKEAEAIMGNSFAMLLSTGLIITVLCYLFKRPMLYLFGASDVTYPFANQYISIYLLGSIFVMIGLGMNSFINAQGFGRIGMLSVVIGAVVNLLLDPILIFGFDMGIQGAAIATVISQMISAIWIVSFLTGKKTILRLRFQTMKLSYHRVKEIIGLGMSGFIMAATNGAVQIACNTTLQSYGGDLYVGVMTVINSIREIVSMPVSGITNSAQPIMGYNYGAKEYERVKKAIKFMAITGITYTTVIWGFLNFFPEFFIRLFNHETELIKVAIPSMRIYYFGFFMMSLQFIGQSTFVALGKSKFAIFFSLLRKAVIVVPLTVLLPQIGNLGTNGVFLAEPISNFLGGTACIVTMLLTVWKELGKSRES